MAVEVEAAGQVDEFLRVLKRRVWWIIIPFVVIGSLGTFFAVVVPKKYVSRTEIMVSDLGSSTGELASSVSTTEGKVATYHIRSPHRIDTVLHRMNWDAFEALNQQEKVEFREKVRDDVSVKLETMPRDSRQQLVKISYKNNEPALATEFLSKLFQSWKDEVLQGQLRQEQNQFATTKQLLDEINRELQLVEERKKKLRTDNNIPPPSTAMDGRSIPTPPPVFADLERDEREVSDYEREIDEKRLELDRLVLERNLLPAKVRPEGTEVLDPVSKEIATLRDAMATIEAYRDEQGWTSEHSDYQRTQSELEAKRARIRRLESKRRTAGTEPDAFIDNPDRVKLTKDIERLEIDIEVKERRISALNARIDTLLAESFRVNEAYAEYERRDSEAQNLRAQRNILAIKKNKHEMRRNELQSEEGNPFEVQLEPTIPTKPTSPNPWMISIGSIVFGLGLGLGLAILKEYSKSCFRSARELSRVMTHPVLGTVNHIFTRRERARALLVRGALGGGSLVFLLSVGYVTWAWARHRDGLTDSLLKAIESFRELLM